MDHRHISWRDRCISIIGSRILRLQEKAQNIQSRRILRQLKECGEGVGVWGRLRVTGAESMVVGDNVHIGDNAVIRAEGGLTIGDNTHISRNFLLYTVNHRYEGDRIPYDEEMIAKPVHIGRNVWIGMNVCVAPGSIIGEGAIVGMGTVVSGEVPRGAIIGSEKWRVLAYRDDDRYRKLDEKGAYAGPNGTAWYPANRPSQENIS